MAYCLHFIMVKMLLIYLMNGCSNANDEVCMASIGGVCHPTWIQWRDKCYKVTEPLPWSEARDECVKMGGVMATPNCEKEAQFLKAITPTTSSRRHLWINCNDLEEEGLFPNYYLNIINTKYSKYQQQIEFFVIRRLYVSMTQWTQIERLKQFVEESMVWQDMFLNRSYTLSWSTDIVEY